jgi:hypothetical protein
VPAGPQAGAVWLLPWSIVQSWGAAFSVQRPIMEISRHWLVKFLPFSRFGSKSILPVALAGLSDQHQRQRPR